MQCSMVESPEGKGHAFDELLAANSNTSLNTYFIGCIFSKSYHKPCLILLHNPYKRNKYYVPDVTDEECEVKQLA